MVRSLINTKKKTKTTRWLKTIKQQYQLLIIGIPFLIYTLTFAYVPLAGWVMAFTNYKPSPNTSMLDNFVGLKNFERLFSNEVFLRSLRNTIAMGALDIVLGTVFAVFLALMINEVKNRGLKKITQTVSYMPHFLSWVVASSIILGVMSVDGGELNELLLFLRIIDEPINWIGMEQYFWFVSTTSQIWKESGWTAIIYLSAITAISMDMYEAAKIDGANRFQAIRFITLPSLMPTIKIMFIINVGNLLNQGFEKQYLLGNSSVINFAEVIDTYVIRYGIGQGNYSFATAAGLFKSVVGIILIITANKISKKATGEGVF
ncbi:sugar ABC transporter permease [Vallitalea pronyensis]|uniref:Sugar ABC transporter permease n=1 Tax=Vallitalea pronyensis TaxID=1348613 RepID=A0A8J8MJU0_9FIRM|nr:ABC transporter permease subunit [Vallitalea pronyensis]QUI22756.1 sugar ABC transporter permease [Vallitalea pronyensis]